eukprot:2461814-Rhodomonas_salina.1
MEYPVLAWRTPHTYICICCYPITCIACAATSTAATRKLFLVLLIPSHRARTTTIAPATTLDLLVLHEQYCRY